MITKRDEIIKALECCKTVDELDCKTCGYKGKIGDDGAYIGCVNCLIADALTLINELTERNEILEAKNKVNDRVGEDFIRVSKENKKLTEENEKLTRNLECANLEIECKERILESYMLQYGTVAAKEVWLKKERADTVRQMQEIINERLDISVEGYSSEEIKSKVCDMVDQIAEEMLEGSQ